MNLWFSKIPHLQKWHKQPFQVWVMSGAVSPYQGCLKAAAAAALLSAGFSLHDLIMAPGEAGFLSVPLPELLTIWVMDLPPLERGVGEQTAPQWKAPKERKTEECGSSHKVRVLTNLKQKKATHRSNGLAAFSYQTWSSRLPLWENKDKSTTKSCGFSLADWSIGKLLLTPLGSMTEHPVTIKPHIREHSGAFTPLPWLCAHVRNKSPDSVMLTPPWGSLLSKRLTGKSPIMPQWKLNKHIHQKRKKPKPWVMVWTIFAFASSCVHLVKLIKVNIIIKWVKYINVVI